MSHAIAYAFGPFVLQPEERLLLDEGKPVRIGARAFDLLSVLVRSGGDILSKEDLLRRVWGTTVVDDGSVRVHIAALRKALGDDATRQAYIANVPLRGYRFVAPVQTRAPERPGSAPSSPPVTPAHEDVTRALSTRLVGRDDTIAAIVARLGEHRLVTLVGPGGMGKTRVALAVADRLRASPLDVCFVDLSPLPDPALEPSAVAASLGVPILSGDAAAHLLAQLLGRSLLIVLDNCEQVVGVVAELAELLLRRLPGVRLLATSREPLGAQGEWVQRLQGLGTPWRDDPLSLTEALGYPAVQLLVEHVCASVDAYELAEPDLDAVVRICRAMDGIPLALELAATHVPSFGLHQLADLLSERVNLLTRGRRTAVARHQTLHAALDWSHELLDDRERAVLRRLSAFRGSFSIHAAAALCECPRIDQDAAADALVQLVNKSMVAMEGASTHGIPGYRLLETTRGYAQMRLAESGEARHVAQRHAQVLCDTLNGPSGWGGIDDVRAAMDWAYSPDGDEPLGLKLTLASAHLWFKLGLLKEFRDRLDTAELALSRQQPDPPRDLQLALLRGHAYLQTLGPTAIGEQAFERATALARRSGQAEDLLSALWSLYSDRMVRGDYLAMLALAREFGAACDATADSEPRFTHHRMMALSLHMAAEHAEALAHAEQARRVPLARPPYRHGSAYQVDHLTSTMVPMARTLWIQGRVDEAADMITHAVDRATELDHGFSTTYMLALAACPIALWNGDDARAREHVRQLKDSAARHMLEFWLEAGRMYEHVLAWWPGGPDEGAPPWLDRFARHGGRADLLATFAVPLLHPHALQRMEANSNPWCAAELRRAHAEREWRAQRLDAPQAARTLQDIVALARGQGAVSWELRATLTLAQCLHAAGRTAEAIDRIEDVMSRLRQGLGHREPRRAERLLKQLRH